MRPPSRSKPICFGESRLGTSHIPQLSRSVNLADYDPHLAEKQSTSARRRRLKEALGRFSNTRLDNRDEPRPITATNLSYGATPRGDLYAPNTIGPIYRRTRGNVSDRLFRGEVSG
ncbi:hypothetical protein AGR5A_pb0083 [Agrobacterium genomosp. 5 str. CFBP 6626]|nr:hypothetical protein AGR5A_pb0083 [Agrobacterium genomosp. 5 str. CFBP 6626]